jgi:hypothetical protein
MHNNPSQHREGEGEPGACDKVRGNRHRLWIVLAAAIGLSVIGIGARMHAKNQECGGCDVGRIVDDINKAVPTEEGNSNTIPDSAGGSDKKPDDSQQVPNKKRGKGKRNKGENNSGGYDDYDRPPIIA